MGIVLAVLLIGGVAAAVVAGRESQDKSTATKTVRGVIGSEKADFFADPDVVKALAAKGFTVKTETSGSWAMEELPLKEQDFAFPSSKTPAGELRRKSKIQDFRDREEVTLMPFGSAVKKVRTHTVDPAGPAAALDAIRADAAALSADGETSPAPEP